MRKHCGNCANHKKETNQFSEECGKCVAAILENGERTDPSHWREKPKTNADRIRAMSDEELADFIDRCEMMDIDYSKTFCNLCNGQYECSQCRLEWLKQPAKEE